MALVALLSNPRSTGNRELLPRVRSFCAGHPEIFHYEVEEVSQIADALRTIARVRPKVIVINGGDGTVQAALTELHLGGHFGVSPPPVAVLPNGKTNLIALELGAEGDPLAALERVVELAGGDLAPHVVTRELIALSDGSPGGRPVLGMFLGGAGLADTMLYCRNTIYPLGLPNGFSHVLTAIAAFLALVFRAKRSRFLPPRSAPIRVSVRRQDQLSGRFALLLVTTLEQVLLGRLPEAAGGSGALRMMAIEQRPSALFKAVFAKLRGRLGRERVTGVYYERGDEIRIEGEQSSVIFDGEMFEASPGHPIVLTPTAPVPFLRLAA